MCDDVSLTPLFRQYFDLKAQYPDCLVLMQCGDFFEAYGDDAETFSQDLEIALTSKEAGGGRKLAMAGVPLHAVDVYLRGLVAHGHRVALAEQTADPAQCKGLVPREVKRIITSGTVLDPAMLDEKNHNYLVGLYCGREGYGLAASDITTGHFSTADFGDVSSDSGPEGSCDCVGAGERRCGLNRMIDDLQRFQPSEIVLFGDSDARETLQQALVAASIVGEHSDISLVNLETRLSAEQAAGELKREFGLASLAGLGLEGRPAAIVASAQLLRYVHSITLGAPVSLEPPRGYLSADCMVLDTCSRRNLELTETLLGRERRGSLLGTIDNTCTSMGARRLRDWMLRPLLNASEVRARHGVVQHFVEHFSLLKDLRLELKHFLDVERLVGRASYGNASARDLLALSQSLSLVPRLRELLDANAPAGAVVAGAPVAGAAGGGVPAGAAGCTPAGAVVAGAAAERGAASPRHGGDCIELWRRICAGLRPHQDLCALLKRGLADDPPALLRDGGVIRPGFNEELDTLRGLRKESKSWIAALEERERQATGIRTLKVGYTSVYGYYIEVTKANAAMVPDRYVRRQTLVNSERYIVSELKEYESKVLGAEDQIRKLEARLFAELREAVASQANTLRALSRAVSELDVLCSFALTATECGWTRPQIVSENVIDVTDLRHPVVEAARGGDFVPNDCFLDMKKHLIILTGPNMSGKSTWLRQVALAVILAQMGSFVPAQKARLGIIDRIFTRVGASDDLHLGQSTFMVEMSETANIVNNATPRSLVILDEIGRGTSTFDGLAIARAVVEYLHDKVKALTLFATHFHELTRLERSLSGCRNCRVAVREMPDEVVFLHKIVPGGADRSYGIYVAKLAGMPSVILARSEYLLKRLESASKRRGRSDEPTQTSEQIGLFSDLE